MEYQRGGTGTVPPLFGCVALFASGLHYGYCRLRNVLHRQGNGLVAAVRNDNELDAGLLGKSKVNGLVFARAGSGGLTGIGILVSRPHQNCGLEKIVQLGGSTPTVVGNLKNIGLQRILIIHVTDDSGGIILDIAENGEALAVDTEASYHTAVIELVQNIGINILLRVEALDIQIADLNSLSGMKLSQLALELDGHSLEITVTVFNVSAGVIRVIVDAGSGNVIQNLLQHDFAAVGIAEVVEVLKVIPVLMRDDPGGNYDLTVCTLIELVERVVKLGFILTGGATAVVYDKTTVLQRDDKGVTEVAGLIVEIHHSEGSFSNLGVRILLLRQICRAHGFDNDTDSREVIYVVGMNDDVVIVIGSKQVLLNLIFLLKRIAGTLQLGAVCLPLLRSGFGVIQLVAGINAFHDTCEYAAVIGGDINVPIGICFYNTGIGGKSEVLIAVGVGEGVVVNGSREHIQSQTDSHVRPAGDQNLVADDTVAVFVGGQCFQKTLCFRAVGSANQNFVGATVGFLASADPVGAEREVDLLEFIAKIGAEFQSTFYNPVSTVLSFNG